MASTERQSFQMRDRQTHKRRSAGVNRGRFLAERWSTPIWWRRARFSGSTAARERKIGDSVTRSVVREMSIGGKNYERSIVPVRSDISRFSRGTVGGDPRLDLGSSSLPHVSKTLRPVEGQATRGRLCLRKAASRVENWATFSFDEPQAGIQ